MRIVYIHASKFGNGAAVAQEFAALMGRRGVEVEVHHVKEVRATELPPADVYVFSSPGRMGKPTRGVRRFLKDLGLPPGTRYALLTTEMQPKPDKGTGLMPTEEEICRFQHVRPIMHELLAAKGLVAMTEGVVHVTDLKGPLEDGWRDTVASFADRLAVAESV